jgi:hypothetical protein
MPHTYSFETTGLWQRTLAPQCGEDPFEAQRTRLREAFMRFRAKSAELAGEIARDLPSRTVHDITHLDALWGIADTIIGDEYPANPAEAFVLGGSFLVHDLAMSRASYPSGLDSLRQQDAWRDTVATLLKTRLGRTPRREEIDSVPEDIADRATEDVIVERHAQQAAELPRAGWVSTGTNDHHYLIEDQELRETYGPTIGEVSHSHWWSVDGLFGKFNQPLGAATWCPSPWEVNKLKVACILRVADVAHLDDRRAPSFLRALRQPRQGSDEFWQFQEHILQPSRVDNRLRYSTKRPFKIAEAAAWWICFDSLQMVDRELRQVDALLADNPPCCDRFEARSVMKVEKPESLADLIKTEDWLPVDAKIRVSDVASLAMNIGGRQLYGDDRTVPLRELVQNAVDALRARHVLEDRQKDWGQVRVTLGKDVSGDWLEVEDTGLGMSKDLLTGPLVDFGSSYWGTQLMRREHPGLLGKGFQSIGQYGIGFFSVFMVGDRVKVTTQRYDQGKEDTLVLQFGAGLVLRPVLRKAQREEWLLEGGTRVRLWLKQAPSRKGGLLDSRNIDGRSLETLCVHLFPALSVNLKVRDREDDEKLIVSADDWKTIPPDELRKRIDPYPEHRFREKESGDPTSEIMRVLNDSSGEIVGRACADPYGGSKRGGDSGIITVGGIRANRCRMIVGIMTGAALRATRDTAVPVVSREELARWATEQAGLATKSGIMDEERSELVDFICACGGETKELPVGWGETGPMTIDQIKALAASLVEVMLSSDYELRSSTKNRKELQLNPNVLLINSNGYRYYLIDSGSAEDQWPESRSIGSIKDSPIRENTIRALIIKTLAATWGTTVEEVLQASEGGEKKQVVGRRGGKEVKADVDVIRRPKA